MNERIKRLLEEKNATQAELADFAGVTPQFVSYILKGQKIPSVAVLRRIADFFNVTMDYLAGREEKEHKKAI